ncbi:uncharacterized protein LOC125944532 [Dermacentor silvarum]|uniref:uncharacterized protein LOC125944532 n=1 Tax=Dermacentor silvarum TaxID=543639 RepID=UPI00210168DB|nr:uncharacterized protein LOC125944532 [Dermacentor silvarum]
MFVLCFLSLHRSHKPVTFYIDGTKSQMLRMVRDLAEAVNGGIILQDDITVKLIDDYLALVECADVNMLMRCAGSRFSDFAVPQCSYAYLNMEPKLWEELSFWNWIWAFLMYQLHWPAIEAVKKRHDASVYDRNFGGNPSQVLRQRKFMMQVQMSKMASVDAIVGVHVNPETRSPSSTLVFGPEQRACKSALGKRLAEGESSLAL